MIASPRRSLIGFLLLVTFIALDYRYGISDDLEIQIKRWISSTHISAHVPDSSETLKTLLNRDLHSHFTRFVNQQEITVESKLLRQLPTHSGAALPKFYSWVTVKDSSGKILTSGAARIAAIEQDHFEVTDYLSAEGINSNPDVVGSVFPAVLVDRILAEARRQP